MERSPCMPCLPPVLGKRSRRSPTLTTNDSDPTGTQGGTEVDYESKGPVCGMCEQRLATRYCEQCEGNICPECEQTTHGKGVFKTHIVRDIEPEAASLEESGPGDEEEDEGHQEGHAHGTGTFVEKPVLEGKDYIFVSISLFCALLIVIIMCLWSQGGLVAEHKGVHEIRSTGRPGHITGALYRTPVLIELPGTEKEYFEVRLIAMAERDVSHYDLHEPHHHRRLSHGMDMELSRMKSDSRRMLTDAGHGPAPAVAAAELAEHSPAANPTGSIIFSLLADGHEYFTESVPLHHIEEIEHYRTVDVGKLGFNNANSYTAFVTSNRTDGKESSFFLQVVRMPASGRSREVIGILIFICTFAVIIAEPIHRVYAAMLGASAALCTVSAIQETVHLTTVIEMIDFGTMTLLFSMMILMRMVQETGFFNWLGAQLVKRCQGDPKKLFYALTLTCGCVSMVLDSVTCTLLFGPLTYTLTKQMNLNPRPYYLSMVMNAVIGGTATLIGDPPNMVLASKLDIGFMAFIYYNFPLICIMLPFSSYYLYYRFQDVLIRGPPKVDIDALVKNNVITDMPKFLNLAVIFSSVLLAMLLSPVHDIEPGWFAVMGVFAALVIHEPHNVHHYLEIVEWDTLLFFSLLFVLIECLAYLGVIALMANGLVGTILAFPVSVRLPAGLIIALWVSTAGGCFLESLPFCTAIAYVLMDIKAGGVDVEGIDPQVLVWPLSVGVIVGGIGTILGSSANLVCLTVSYRYGEVEEDYIRPGDFPKYGMPLLLMLITGAMVWQLILFAAMKLPASP